MDLPDKERLKISKFKRLQKTKNLGNFGQNFALEQQEPDPECSKMATRLKGWQAKPLA
jgi:hypothetical protein